MTRPRRDTRRFAAARRAIRFLTLGLMASIAAGLTSPTARAQDSNPNEEIGVRLESVAAAEAAIFVIESYLREDNDLNAVAAQYADVVAYYDLGPQSIETVLADKAAYLRRWPSRRFAPDLGTLEVTEVDDGALQVSIEVDFDVANDTNEVSGRSLIEITVARASDGFKIVAESGRVLDRR